MEGDSRGGDNSFRGGKIHSPAFLRGDGLAISDEDALNGSGLDLRQVFLDSDETGDTEGAEVTEVGPAAEAHFER